MIYSKTRHDFYTPLDRIFLSHSKYIRILLCGYFYLMMLFLLWAWPFIMVIGVACSYEHGLFVMIMEFIALSSALIHSYNKASRSIFSSITPSYPISPLSISYIAYTLDRLDCVLFQIRLLYHSCLALSSYLLNYTDTHVIWHKESTAWFILCLSLSRLGYTKTSDIQTSRTFQLQVLDVYKMMPLLGETGMVMSVATPLP